MRGNQLRPGFGFTDNFKVLGPSVHGGSPSNAEATLNCPKHKDKKIFENHPNPVMLVLIM